MRQVLAVAVLVVVSGCTKSNDIPPVVPPVIDPPTVVCDGDVTITTSAEMDAFVARGCTSVTGTLSIVGTDLTNVALNALVSVGSLEVTTNTELVSVILPALTKVRTSRSCSNGGLSIVLTVCSGGLYVGGNDRLSVLDLPALDDAGSLDVAENTSLPSCSALAPVGRLRASGWAGRATVTGNGDSTTCPGLAICQGSVLSGGADRDALVTSGCREVAGDLTIVSTDLTALELPKLTTVGGLLYVTDNDAMTSFSLPELTSVGGLVFQLNDALTSFTLSTLTTVDDLLYIAGNAQMTSFTLPLLSTVGGSLEVVGNFSLGALDIPELTAAGQLGVSGNATLSSFSLPALIAINMMGVRDNASLTSFSLPALTTLPYGFTVESNPSLPQCLALAFKDHMVTAHGFTAPWYISGNDTTATCLPVVCEGDVIITSSAEMPAFIARGCTTVTGTLIITGTDLTEVSLPGLVSAGGLEISSNPQLARVSLPTLATVPNNALHPWCSRTPVNSTGLAVYDNPSLTTVEVPSLREAGSIYLGALPVVTLDMPALTKVESFVAENNPALTSLNLPALSAATGRSGSFFCYGVLWIWQGGLGIQGNPALGSLLLPSMANAEEAAVINNGSLTHLALPSLRQCATAFTVVDNGSLRQCEAEVILAQLTATPATVTISGNDTTAICPP
jgi:hypothetical protein